MKAIKLTLILIFSSLLINAQNEPTAKQTLQIGLNSAFFGSGDMTGIGLNVEYNYPINKYFSLSPRIMSANANGISNRSYSKSVFNHTSLFGISLSGKITPFPNNFKRLKVDLGGLFQKLTYTWGDIDTSNYYGIYSTNNTSYNEENLFGFIGSISYDLIDTKNIVSGFRFDLLTSLYEGYLECDGFQTGIYFGIKF